MPGIVNQTTRFPILQFQNGSGLSYLPFPWAEYVGKTGSTFDVSFGAGGVNTTFQMLIYWEDLGNAVQAILGYSERVEYPGAPSSLSRALPWPHPVWSQMWATRITRAVGVQFTGLSTDGIQQIVGSGAPSSSYNCVILTIQFNRPPYAIMTDGEILDQYGYPNEWLRFTDRQWTPSVQILSREGQQFYFQQGPPATTFQPFPGSVGYPLCKLAMTRRWYQLPQSAVLTAEPNGFPTNLVTAIGGGVYVNLPTQYQYPITGLFAPQQAPIGGPILGTVNALPFFGCPAGTLLYETPEIIPQPLPLPPELMFLSNQVGDMLLQYDVVFHFSYFNPPQGTGNTNIVGHNCFPWTGDTLWYPAANTSSGGTKNYAFQSYLFPLLWQIM